MTDDEMKSMCKTIAAAGEFLISVASDFNVPQLWEFLPDPEKGKTDPGVIIAFTGTEEEMQIAVDFVRNLVERRNQQAIAANN